MNIIGDPNWNLKFLTFQNKVNYNMRRGSQGDMWKRKKRKERGRGKVKDNIKEIIKYKEGGGFVLMI